MFLDDDLALGDVLRQSSSSRLVNDYLEIWIASSVPIVACYGCIGHIGRRGRGDLHPQESVV
jgi:hypothetical protein